MFLQNKKFWGYPLIRKSLPPITFNISHKEKKLLNEVRGKSITEGTGNHLTSKSNQGTSASILSSIEISC